MTKSTPATPAPTGEHAAALKLMERSKKAFRRNRWTASLTLAMSAIERLEMLWDSTANRAVGRSLSEAYMLSCYAAGRKGYRGRKTDRAGWMAKACAFEKIGVDLDIQLTRDVSETDVQTIFGTLCHVHNMATDSEHRGQDDLAWHYLAEGYDLIKTKAEPHQMPETLISGFKCIEARLFLKKGEHAKALECAEAAIAAERSLVERKRRRKRKLPPASWLATPTELREKILAAMPKDTSRKEGCSCSTS